MEDLDDSVSTPGFQPLFIQEEDGALAQRVEGNAVQSGLTFAGSQLNQSALIKPYLQEMDDLLKSCEELGGIPFASHFSASYSESSPIETTQCKEEVRMESYRETNISPHAYLSTSYIDTQMDKAGVEDLPQGLGSIANRCVSTDVSLHTDMPLTTAGNKLCDTMVEYEGQLLGMLAMLDGCVGEDPMDFEQQDWATDASQEYVHISNSPNCRGGTTVQPAEMMKLECRPVPDQSWGVSRESRNLGEVGSAMTGSQHSCLLGCDNRGGFSVENMERSGIESSLNFEQGVLDLKLSFSVPSMPLQDTENDPRYCEAIKTGYMSTQEETNKEDMTDSAVDDTECPTEERKATTDQRSGTSELWALESQMEACIEEVQCLEKNRKVLLSKLLELRGHKDQEEAEEHQEDEETGEQTESKVAELLTELKREEEGRREKKKMEIQGLREQRAEEEKRMWKVNLERQALQEERSKLKKRLFVMVRDCALSQAALKAQHREVEFLKREEEKLQSLVLQLTEESSQLRAAHQRQLSGLQAELQAQRANQPSSTQEMTQCKRHSCGDIQQYLQGGLRALEDRYEPMLMALLNRRESTAGTLVKAKEQAQQLKAELTPLREEIQKLKLQRACLEEKLKLICMHRREDMGQYKETVYCLEEDHRELKTELTIQKRKNKEIQEQRENLTRKLFLYRAAIEDHSKCDHEEKT